MPGSPDTRLAVLAALLLLLAAASSGITVRDGVVFNLTEGNSTIETGGDHEFNSITVYGDSVTLGSSNLSVVYEGSGTANTTLWNFTIEEIVNQPSVKIGANGSQGKAITFNVTNAITERTYRIDRDGERKENIETGTEGVISWNHSDWTQRSNFTATLLETLKNATVILQGGFDHPSDTLVIDGEEEPSEGLYTEGNVDFGYATFELANEVAGIVPAGSFLELQFTNRSGSYELSQTQSAGNSIFLLPLTEGTSDAVEDRQSEIQGTLFGGGDFLSFPGPSFAYEMSDEKTVRVSLSYNAIDLAGFRDTLSPGTYTVAITNNGIDGGETQVNISVQ